MTSPFPLQPVNAPQAPYLRPETVHELPGDLGGLAPILLHVGQQLQQQQAQQQDMLVRKGQLAVEQERADAEIEQHKQAMQMAKQKQDTLNQTAAQLSQALQTASSPEAMIEGLQKSIGGLVAGGDPQQAMETVKSVVGMRQLLQAQQRQDAERQWLQTNLTTNAHLLNDPKGLNAVRATVVAHGNPDLVKMFDQAFPAKQFGAAAPGATVFDTQTGKPAFLAPSKTATASNSMAQRVQFAANRALDGLKDAENVLKKDDNADVLPWSAQVAQAAGGKGSTELGESAKQEMLEPNQKLFDRALTQVAHSISGLMGGGQRSIYIFQSMQSAYRPNAGQSDLATRQAFRQARADLKADLLKLKGGDLTVLSKFGFLPNEIEQLGGPPADQAANGLTIQPNSSAAIAKRYSPNNPFAQQQ